MDQVVDFDWPWWTIETLLQWIGKDEEEGFAEIHKNAEHLDFTGERGPLHPRFWELKPRAGIPDIDFASGRFLKLDGYYVYVPSYPNRTVPEGWEYLLLRAANAKAIWPPPPNVSEARVDGGDGQTKSTRGGRPTQGAQIEQAFLVLLEAKKIDWEAPMIQLYPAIREKITGTEAVSKGLGNEAIRKVVSPLHHAHKPSHKP